MCQRAWIYKAPTAGARPKAQQMAQQQRPTQRRRAQKNESVIVFVGGRPEHLFSYSRLALLEHPLLRQVGSYIMVCARPWSGSLGSAALPTGDCRPATLAGCCNHHPRTVSVHKSSRDECWSLTARAAGITSPAAGGGDPCSGVSASVPGFSAAPAAEPSASAAGEPAVRGLAACLFCFLEAGCCEVGEPCCRANANVSQRAPEADKTVGTHRRPGALRAGSLRPPLHHPDRCLRRRRNRRRLRRTLIAQQLAQCRGGRRLPLRQRGRAADPPAPAGKSAADGNGRRIRRRSLGA